MSGLVIERSLVGGAGFEWVYRFFMEPRKLCRRDMLDGQRFIFHAGINFLRNREN
jgi:UDP-N-acetyl-D-mannosaminuronic acid transferase (WecB/TagA/CpsF family)